MTDKLSEANQGFASLANWRKQSLATPKPTTHLAQATNSSKSTEPTNYTDNTMHAYPEKEYVRVVLPTGEEARFNRTWGGHRFTDDEVLALKQGYSLRINTPKTRGIVGELDWQEYEGHTFLGFASWATDAYTVENAPFPVTWNGHTFTHGEEQRLRKGRPILITGFSKRTGRPYGVHVRFKKIRRMTATTHMPTAPVQSPIAMQHIGTGELVDVLDTTGTSAVQDITYDTPQDDYVWGIEPDFDEFNRLKPAWTDVRRDPYVLAFTPVIPLTPDAVIAHIHQYVSEQDAKAYMNWLTHEQAIDRIRVIQGDAREPLPSYYVLPDTDIHTLYEQLGNRLLNHSPERVRMAGKYWDVYAKCRTEFMLDVQDDTDAQRTTQTRLVIQAGLVRNEYIHGDRSRSDAFRFMIFSMKLVHDEHVTTY